MKFERVPRREAVLALLFLFAASAVAAISQSRPAANAKTQLSTPAEAPPTVINLNDRETAISTPANLNDTLVPQTNGGPKLVQTNDYDYAIATHEVTSASSYTYVTPAGNYSFSIALPWEVSYTSLWGNTTSFSAYGVREHDHFVVPSTSVVTLGASQFGINTTEGIVAEGYLYCLYNFGATPETTSCSYSQVKGNTSQFSIVWITVGDYVRAGASTYQTSTQSANFTLGSYREVEMGSSTSSNWSKYLNVDWSDFGNASVYYGKLGFPSSIYGYRYGIMVMFPIGASNIDPTLVQSGGSGTAVGYCGFPSDVTAGDLLIVDGTYMENFAESVSSDTEGLTWQQENNLYGASHSQSVFWAVATSTHAETVNLGGHSYAWFAIQCEEFSGVASTIVDKYSTGTGSASGTYTGSVTSYTPAYGDFVFVNIDGTSTGGSCSTAFTAGSGYTIALQACNQYTNGSSYPTGDEFISSAGGTSTTSPINSGYGATGVWGEISLAFLTYVSQPIKATASGVSTGTISVSGCGASPSTFPGDGAAHDISASPLCSLTLTAPSGDVWSGTRTTTTETTCSSATCPQDNLTYEHVTQPITATLSGLGSNVDISVSGCDASPTTFPGNASLQDVTAIASCNLTLGLSTPGYVWQTTGDNSTSVPTCDMATCGDISLHYMKYVQPLNNPSNFVNLTGSEPSVQVGLFNATYNDLAGGSCSVPVFCTPSLGGYSFQFNAVFPEFLVHNYTEMVDDHLVYDEFDYCGNASSINYTTDGKPSCAPFMMQATIEFDANGTCKAVPQGGPASYPAPKVTPAASFDCSDITAPGADFEWILTNSSGYFTSIQLKVNGTPIDTWNASSIFDVTHWPGDVNMTWAYAESTFAGPGNAELYGNFYAGGGYVTYSGTEAITGHWGWGGLEITGEYSNVQYTTIPASVRSSNQTYEAGAFLSSYVGYSGLVTTPSSIVGPPSGAYAQLEATTSGSTACVEGSFDVGRPPINGTIAIYGYSYSPSSNITVYVSNSKGSCSAGSWTKLNESMWTAGSPQWLAMGSVTNAEYVKIVAADAGSDAGGANIFVYSVSAFIGSYAQKELGTYESSSGVTNPSDLLEMPGSDYTNLQASVSGSSAWINASLGTEYSGKLIIYGYSESDYYSNVTVLYSSTGANGSWTKACQGTLDPGSPGAIGCGAVTDALYIEIMVTDAAGIGQPADLYIDGLYVA
jgi:hypothetical protein